MIAEKNVIKFIRVVFPCLFSNGIYVPFIIIKLVYEFYFRDNPPFSDYLHCLIYHGAGCCRGILRKERNNNYLLIIFHSHFYQDIIHRRILVSHSKFYFIIISKRKLQFFLYGLAIF